MDCMIVWLNDSLNDYSTMKPLSPPADWTGLDWTGIYNICRAYCMYVCMSWRLYDDWLTDCFPSADRNDYCCMMDGWMGAWVLLSCWLIWSDLIGLDFCCLREGGIFYIESTGCSPRLRLRLRLRSKIFILRNKVDLLEYAVPRTENKCQYH